MSNNFPTGVHLAYSNCLTPHFLPRKPSELLHFTTDENQIGQLHFILTLTLTFILVPETKNDNPFQSGSDAKKPARSERLLSQPGCFILIDKK
jgi:hypothetical protein